MNMIHCYFPTKAMHLVQADFVLGFFYYDYDWLTIDK